MTPVILIVDDHPANRETLCALLDGQEYQLLEAADGASALRLAAATTPDLVLLDVMMPDMDGYEVCRRLRADPRLAEVPVIIVTALEDMGSRLAGLEAGADDYVSKPFNRSELRARVRTITRLNRYRRLQDMQAQLREIEERFRKLAEHSDEVFWFHTVDPVCISYLSPAVEKIWGWPAARFYEDPQLWTRSIHEDDRARVHAVYESVVAGRTDRFEEEYRIVSPSGVVRWVLTSGTPIRGKDGKIASLGGVAHDITERKNAQELMLRAQRLESLGMLAAGIAHDFNNALAPVLMGSQLLRMHITNPGGLRTLDTVENSAKLGAGLVQQLLSFTRGSGRQQQLTQVAPLLLEVIELAKATFPKAITVEHDLSGELWAVHGNATQIHQVFLNLCVNARDAMPQGGKLTLRAANCVLDETAATGMGDARPGKYITVTVSDTGTGIPPDVLAHVWEPFFTTKGDGKGTGLGLSTVRGIVDNHGGFVVLQTQPGQGTVFTVYLPAAMDKADGGTA